jgi:ATPase subunit of ABC transporter with duplicated ATPase domains
MSKKEKDYQLQEKTIKDFMRENQISQEKAEKKTLQKLCISHLKEKPKEYKVNFILHGSDDQRPAIDMLDVSFAYEVNNDASSNRQLIFNNLRLKVYLFCHILYRCICRQRSDYIAY